MNNLINLFIINAINNGWTVRIVNNKHIFTKKHNNNKIYFKKHFVEHFIIDCLNNIETKI
jgi:hypothetical protein